jgi:hypothetical protein
MAGVKWGGGEDELLLNRPHQGQERQASDHSEDGEEFHKASLKKSC